MTISQYLLMLIPLIVLIMARPTPIGHKVLALARQDMWQSAITGRVSLTRATINRIIRRHAATGTLVPGNSNGASLEDHTLSRP